MEGVTTLKCVGTANENAKMVQKFGKHFDNFSSC